jgi:putative ATP-binding cassette transporter
VVAAFTVSQRFVLRATALEVEGAIHRLRSRLIEKVRHCELDGVEHIGRTRIFKGLSTEIQTISQTGNGLGMLIQMGVMLIFATLYLISVSMTAFILTLVFTLAAAALYFSRLSRMNTAVQKASKAEYELHDHLSGMLDGFKEIKLNEKRSDELTKDLLGASQKAADARIVAQGEFAYNFVFTQNVFFLLLGTVVFLVPMLSEITSDSLTTATTAVLYLFSPISALVSAVPILASANAAAININSLETQLSQTVANGTKGSTAVPVEDGPSPNFSTIEFRSAEFLYERDHGDRSFVVGPIDLVLNAGEVVFISGGNGSGKSTFMRLLTAIQMPQRGTILLDGRPVDHAFRPVYRSLFSSVFSDYFLFKRLYGIDDANLDKVPGLLELFELTDKTHLVDREFSTVDLSAGQRKRLALIVAMLEHRKICILDEWAADQDPLFRQKFYTELIPMLKAEGKTVICVSHDDRYYELADRRLHFEDGRIVMNRREKLND